MNARRYFILMPTMVFLGGSLTGCKTDEQRLLEQAQAYWQARAANDLNTAYAMESGSLPGGGVDQLTYSRVGAGMILKDPAVSDPIVEGTSGKVTVRLTLVVPAMRGGRFPQESEDAWVKIKGRWYHDSEQLNLK